MRGLTRRTLNKKKAAIPRLVRISIARTTISNSGIPLAGGTEDATTPGSTAVGVTSDAGVSVWVPLADGVGL
jgi:hypothetical protein